MAQKNFSCQPCATWCFCFSKKLPGWDRTPPINWISFPQAERSVVWPLVLRSHCVPRLVLPRLCCVRLAASKHPWMLIEGRLPESSSGRALGLEGAELREVGVSQAGALSEGGEGVPWVGPRRHSRCRFRGLAHRKRE